MMLASPDLPEILIYTGMRCTSLIETGTALHHIPTRSACVTRTVSSTSRSCMAMFVSYTSFMMQESEHVPDTYT